MYCKCSGPHSNGALNEYYNAIKLLGFLIFFYSKHVHVYVTQFQLLIMTGNTEGWTFPFQVENKRKRKTSQEHDKNMYAVLCTLLPININTQNIH